MEVFGVLLHTIFPQEPERSQEGFVYRATISMCFRAVAWQVLAVVTWWPISDLFLNTASLVDNRGARVTWQGVGDYAVSGALSLNSKVTREGTRVCVLVYIGDVYISDMHLCIHFHIYYTSAHLHVNTLKHMRMRVSVQNTYT